MSTESSHVAAAPAWVRALLAGPDRPARVVHRGPDAVYTETDGVCLGVLSTAAAPVPCGLRTTVAILPEDLRDARTARWGRGRLALDGADVVVTRTVDTRVPPLGARTLVGARAGLDAALRTTAAGPRLDLVAAELPPDALEALARGDARGVPALVGRGSGLTPVGDDVLAGWLATAVAATALPGRADPVARAVAGAATRTTALSGTLLACAARGEVLPAFRRLLVDLAVGREPGPAVAALLAVGHTSGAGLLLGTSLALRFLTPAEPVPAHLVHAAPGSRR